MSTSNLLRVSEGFVYCSKIESRESVITKFLHILVYRSQISHFEYPSEYCLILPCRKSSDTKNETER